ncbi:MAG: hypothetical protein RR382_06360 [Tannerellaceae bacterium]
MKIKIHIIWGGVCLLLLTLSIGLYYSYNHLLAETAKLHTQLTDLTEEEEHTSVVRRVSKQMEDIAYQQKDISDKQREKAVIQTQIATEMRNQAESERLKAQDAERQAVSAYKLAEEQRSLAEVKQQQAEYSKRVADTLSYIALGRSLGSLSAMQYQVENQDIASLMAYSAWLYTSRYRGDVYQPAIFNALTISSKSVTSWSRYRGGITRIVPNPSSKDVFITVSKYGEIIRWQYTGGNKINDKLLFSDSNYDFRDALIDNQNTIYALSHNGYLVVKPEQGESKSILLDDKEFMRIIPFDSKYLLLVAKHSLSFYQKEGLKFLRTIPLSQPISAVGHQNKDYVVFGQGGFASRINKDGQVVPFSTMIKEKVTAYAWSSQLQMGAAGSVSGTIYLLNAEGDILNKLIRHRSNITQLTFNGNHLLSSSYDCTLNQWYIGEGKQEAVTVRTTGSWLYCFALLEEGSIWTGDESSTLSRIVISPEVMALQVKNNLKRDFTDDEWRHYIGENIPFESFKPKALQP